MIIKYDEKRNAHMSKPITTVIQASVLTQTQEALQRCAETLGLSIGEVIDRTILNFSCTDPDKAFILFLDEFMILARDQTPEQLRRSMFNVMSLFVKSLLECEQLSPPELFEEILRHIGKNV